MLFVIEWNLKLSGGKMEILHTSSHPSPKIVIFREAGDLAVQNVTFGILCGENLLMG